MLSIHGFVGLLSGTLSQLQQVLLVCEFSGDARLMLGMVWEESRVRVPAGGVADAVSSTELPAFVDLRDSGDCLGSSSRDAVLTSRFSRMLLSFMGGGLCAAGNRRGGLADRIIDEGNSTKGVWGGRLYKPPVEESCQSW